MTNDLIRHTQAIKLFLSFHKLASFYNYDGKEATEAANNAVKNISGIDLIELINLEAW